MSASLTKDRLWVAICFFLTMTRSQYNFGGPCDCTVSVVFSSPSYSAGTSRTWNGETFTSTSNDLLAPWYSESVTFQGPDTGGGVTIFDYLISCIQPCSISSISIEGAAFGNTDIFTLYNGDKTVELASMTLTGGNTWQLHTLTVPSRPPTIATTFRLVETNEICCWRLRSYLTMTTVPSISSSPTAATIPPTPAPTVVSTSSVALGDACGCTVSVSSASSTYPAGTLQSGYTSTSDNPLAPWWGESVTFYGTDVGDTIIFDFHVSCLVSCWIKEVHIEGVAWINPNPLTLYNADMSVEIGSMLLTGGNVFNSFVLDLSTTPFYATSFHLVETNPVCCFRYRSLLNLVTVAAATSNPTVTPSDNPSSSPITTNPTASPTDTPTFVPSESPTVLAADPTSPPISSNPTLSPLNPSSSPASPTSAPTNAISFPNPTATATENPSSSPSQTPSVDPTEDNDQDDDNNQGEVEDETETTTDSVADDNDQGQSAVNSFVPTSGPMIGAVGAGIVLIACLLVCCGLYLIRRRKKGKEMQQNMDQGVSTKTGSGIASLSIATAANGRTLGAADLITNDMTQTTGVASISSASPRSYNSNAESVDHDYDMNPATGENQNSGLPTMGTADFEGVHGDRFNEQVGVVAGHQQSMNHVHSLYGIEMGGLQQRTNEECVDDEVQDEDADVLMDVNMMTKGGHDEGHQFNANGNAPIDLADGEFIVDDDESVIRDDNMGFVTKGNADPCTMNDDDDEVLSHLATIGR